MHPDHAVLDPVALVCWDLVLDQDLALLPAGPVALDLVGLDLVDQALVVRVPLAGVLVVLLALADHHHLREVLVDHHHLDHVDLDRVVLVGLVVLVVLVDLVDLVGLGLVDLDLVDLDLAVLGLVGLVRAGLVRVGPVLAASVLAGLAQCSRSHLDRRLDKARLHMQCHLPSLLS